MSRTFNLAQSSKLKAQSSFTLIELLITILLVSILIGTVWTVSNVGMKVFYTQWTRTGIKGEVGRAFINIGVEVRQATSVTTSQATNFIFVADTDNDGVDETIQYSWSGTAEDPLTRTSGASTTTVVNSVNNLALSYFDSNNNSTSTASQVRLVSMDITVSSQDETFELRSKIKLRDL